MTKTRRDLKRKRCGVFKRAHLNTTPEQRDALIEELLEKFPDKMKEVEDVEAYVNEVIEHEASADCFKDDNGVYQVLRRKVETPLGPMIWLSIKRLDKKPIRDWAEMQEIKNQLIGPECEAVELYPATARAIDDANYYHLWGLPDPTTRFPFGFNEPADQIEKPNLKIATPPAKKLILP